MWLLLPALGLAFYFLVVNGGRSAHGLINGQIFATIGESGSGKSFTRMVWAIEYFFPRPHLGYLVTNVPFDVEAVAKHFDYLSSRRRFFGLLSPDTRVNGDDIRRRLVVIPATTGLLGEFMEQEGEPELFMENLTRQYNIPTSAPVHLMIDETHHYISTSHSQKWKDSWKRLLSTIRKKGVRFEIMTQAWEQLPGFLQTVCEAQIIITAAGSRRDEMFKIPFRDWYNLRAALPWWLSFGMFTGFWQSSAWIKEKKGFDTSNETISERCTPLHSFYFQFYNTADNYSVDADAETARMIRVKEDWEVFDRGQVLRSFWNSYKWAILISPWSGFAVAILVMIFCPVSLWVEQGLDWTMGSAMSLVRGSTKTKKPAAAVVQKAEPSKVSFREPSSTVQSVKPVSSSVVRPAVASQVVEPGRNVVITNLIDAEGVYFEGLYYVIGEEIETGILAGEKLSAVDLRRGLARTDNDSLLRLPHGSVLAEGAPPGVPGAVSGAAAVATSNGPGIGEAQRPHQPASGPHASRRIRPLSGPASRGVDGSQQQRSRAERIVISPGRND